MGYDKSRLDTTQNLLLDIYTVLLDISVDLRTPVKFDAETPSQATPKDTVCEGNICEVKEVPKKKKGAKK